jgi:hypothetical protein
MSRALVALLIAAAALAAVVPAGAIAKNAGGTQYTDPLDPGPGQHSNPPPQSTPSTPSTPSSASPSGAGTSPTATASAGTTAASASVQAGTSGEIPRTGFPVGMLMFAGALCLSGGLALRRAAGITGA